MGHDGYHNTGFLFISFGLEDEYFIRQIQIVTDGRLFGLFSCEVRNSLKTGRSTSSFFPMPSVANGTAIPDFQHAGVASTWWRVSSRRRNGGRPARDRSWQGARV